MAVTSENALMAEREGELIERTQQPITVRSLAHDLGALGVKPATTLLVHSSLSSLGWVCGGPAAVILALEHVVGPAGTLVMPTHSSDLSDPARWTSPPVPESWWATIRAEMPPFDPDLTPCRRVGVIAECFRKQQTVRRSWHPQVSFAAWGLRAEEVTRDHSLARFGERSPLAKVYDADGWVLLLGVTHASNTSLHLAEYRAAWPGKRTVRPSAPMMVDGNKRWIDWDDIEIDDHDFATIGDRFAHQSGLQREGLVGQATAMLLPQRPLVDFAVTWMAEHRKAPTSDT